ncbi:hypothetical protein C2I19_20465, partial [Chromobacterium alticapitis]
MRHRTLAKSLHCDEINPYIDLQDSPFYIVRDTQSWTPLSDARGKALPLRAGVSSFGFGGVNAHVVLEEYRPPAAPANAPAIRPQAFVLSAKTSERLREQAARLLAALAEYGEDDLDALAYTLQTGREAMGFRLACMAASLDELRGQLQGYLADAAELNAVYAGEAKHHREAMAALGGDEELQATLGRWPQRGKLGKLLSLWSKGLDVDWSRLYGNERPRRLALPTYPFAQERYWVAPRLAGGAASTRTA